jgi:hypothetical protein
MGDESKIFVYSGNEKTEMNETSVIRSLCIFSYYSMPENVYYNGPPAAIFSESVINCISSNQAEDGSLTLIFNKQVSA